MYKGLNNIHSKFKFFKFRFFGKFEAFLVSSKYWDRMRKHRGNCVYIRKLNFSPSSVLQEIFHFELFVRILVPLSMTIVRTNLSWKICLFKFFYVRYLCYVFSIFNNQKFYIIFF